MKTHEQIATSWAAMSLAQAGCVLHAADYGWDIECADGHWETANNWRELCKLARKFGK